MIEYSRHIFLRKSIVRVTHQQTGFPNRSVADHDTFQHLPGRNVEITANASILSHFHRILPTFRAESRHGSCPEVLKLNSPQVTVTKPLAWQNIPITVRKTLDSTCRESISRQVGDPRVSSRSQNNPSPSTAVVCELATTPTTCIPLFLHFSSPTTKPRFIPSILQTAFYIRPCAATHRQCQEIIGFLAIPY